MQVMKENREEGKIPVRCFYTTYKGNHGDKYIMPFIHFYIILWFI